MQKEAIAREIPALAATLPTTLLVGNPNVGKSVIFGILTGNYATVSNFPGTTVEVTRGKHKHSHAVVLDTPGANSLLPSSDDERVTRDILCNSLREGSARVIQVCDAKNLHRGLLLTLQLAEFEAPMILVANMLDEAVAEAVGLDLAGIGAEIGIEVHGAVAVRGQGVEPLLSGSPRFRPSTLQVEYDPRIESAIEKISVMLPAHLGGKRGIAITLLSADDVPGSAAWSTKAFERTLHAIRAELMATLPAPLVFLITRARLNAVAGIVRRHTNPFVARRGGWKESFGNAAMHPVWGFPIACAALYLVYLFVGVLGAGNAVNFLERTVFAQYIVPWSDAALRFVLPGSLETFLLGAAGTPIGTGSGFLIGDYGLLSVALSYSIAIILPIVSFFFIAFSIMEDSGYLPRLAVVLNRIFKVMGLNGKAVLPMILGLGCDTMATMTARILPTVKERILVTLLLALAVPCSAQLGVILAMMGALSGWATMVWLGSIVLVMLLVGFLANLVIPGEKGDFILEIPPIRRPSLRNVAIKTLTRVEWYLREAVPLFILGTLILWGMSRFGLLQALHEFGAPVVVHLLGLPAKASEAFLIGFLRRDYGAAGLFDLFKTDIASGHLPVLAQIQIIVSMVTITLFVPCIANFFVMIKERGLKTALLIAGFVFPFAFVAGAALNAVLRGILL